MPKHQIKNTLGNEWVEVQFIPLEDFISHLLKLQILYTTFTHHQSSNKTLQLETAQLLHRS